MYPVAPVTRARAASLIGSVWGRRDRRAIGHRASRAGHLEAPDHEGVDEHAARHDDGKLGVLADADLPRVAHLAVRGRFLNAGQSCISPKRFIVEAAVAEEFTPLVIEETLRLNVGDPEKPGTDVGPMARRDLRDQVAAQVRAAVAAGATVLCGGDPRDDLGGFFYPPTVLGDVTPAVSVYREEVFGPVAAIITVADAD